ncbi:DNA methyltransferase [uncultured Microscilla sp.]|uniref:Eco57I restriction-modification methylase domain-containing protein n=1 Tax=uncultured Microscilla sp. TaxID=432653 RepID=UPI00262FF48F|nr:DNA methyltransferase [uncultured Microscilla sp.]
MSLFQKSVLNKYLKAQDQDKIKAAYQKFTDYFHNPARQENIRNAKEEQFQEGFLRELFVKVLGYTLNPEPDYNLTTEFKNERGAKKADGAILKGGKAIAVIELKGTDTQDLDKVNDQAFGYKNNQSNCLYVVTSNFEKLRFFIHNAVEHLEFNLFTLSYDDFAILWLCLHLDNVLADIPLKTKEDSIQVEENITKQLYKDYSTFKHELWQNICKNSPDIDPLLLFKKSQKLLDRFLFIFFAEDSGLLPPNSINKIIDKWTKDDEWGSDLSLYDIYKQYFGFINKGRPAKGSREEIFAYNGGLFLPDEILDNLSIDNELLAKHTAKLSAYDFQSEVDVNILGHIFENSLNEIENVTAQLQGLEVDKSKTKRKKDGVFYTPKYITKYIVDNTVGALCTAKKAELGVIDEAYAKSRKGRKKATIKKLDTALKQYRDWLLNITICDPACGSGAFLNQALEYLIDEHAYIDELNAQLFGSSIIFQDVSNHVLENNIFGVDINEESVEIAKLSLWLRTAQKGRKLTSLNNNIKCGNSLIDDPTVAGEKAFNWQNEFPTVFENGGFDVVVGNPPYVRVQTIKDSIASESIYLERVFKSATRRYDLFVLFMENSYKLVQESGVVQFILPHKFLVADFGYGIRQFLKENYFIGKLIHFGHEIVFESASTYTCIVELRKNSTELLFTSINPKNLLDGIEFSGIDFGQLNDEKWELNDAYTTKLLNKLKKQPNSLEKILDGISQGIKNTSDKIFMLRGKFNGDYFYGYSEELQQEVEIEAEIMLPVAKGKDIKRFEPLGINYHVVYPHYFNGVKTIAYEEEELQSKYPKAYNYLSLFKDFLIEKKIRFKTNPIYWYSLHRSRELQIFQSAKIVSATIQNYPHFTIDFSMALTDAGGYSLIIKNNLSLKQESLLGILNSKLLWFFIKSTSSVYRGGYYAFNTSFLNPFPIPDIRYIGSSKLDEYTTHNIKTTSNLLNAKHQLIKLVKNSFGVDQVSKKLQSWYELDFKAFLSELEKARKKVAKDNGQDYKKLSLSDQSEWMEYFNEQKEKAQALQAEINQTDAAIDALVYELYGLTDEEIKIVEAGV